jgi:phospholipid transport system transporter-binding protein
VIRRDGPGIAVEGPLNLATVPPLVESGAAMIAAGADAVDLAGATDLDSSAVALLLEWTRRARAAGRRLVVLNAPAALRSLVELYGVGPLLDLDRSTAR